MLLRAWIGDEHMQLTHRMTRSNASTTVISLPCPFCYSVEVCCRYLEFQFHTVLSVVSRTCFWLYVTVW